VADEKEQTSEEPQAPAKKKKLTPILMVVLGAVLGGAGVVFLAPQPPQREHAPTAPDIRLYDHPTAMEFTINPVVERGSKTAMVQFLFSYKADHRDVQPGGDGAGHGADAEGGSAELSPVLKSIAINWNRAYSRCLEVLSNQKASVFVDPEGKRRLKRTLIDELSATLFPDGIATVDDILWKKMFVQ
jgi:flagellar basal body-associated protein FliL